MNVFDQIKERRLALGMTRQQLADASGLARTYIADVESGRRNPAVKNLQKIAKALGTTITLQ